VIFMSCVHCEHVSILTISTSLACIHCFDPTLQENVVFLKQKAMSHDTCEVNFVIHPLQYTMCDVYCDMYYIKREKLTLNNDWHVIFVSRKPMFS
jgi:hypothetical protein